jgi:hypothetical protein
MSFLLGKAVGVDHESFQRGWTEYRAYLDSIRDHLPVGAKRYAFYEWPHDDRHGHPHDSWVETVTISEPASGKRHARRRLSIRVQLLGAWQDGLIVFDYKDVASYSIQRPVANLNESRTAGHGDWLVDEIRFSTSDELVLHEIEFSSGARWLIQCGDLSYEWKPFNASTNIKRRQTRQSSWSSKKRLL